MIPYKYFVVVDFEATCDDTTKPDPQEIIEFPAILIDVEKREVVDTFHTYVRPTFHPLLTPFCTSLTGIAQHTVDAAPTFPEVWNSFTAWLAPLEPNSYCMLSCGAWDFKTLLPKNLQIHDINGEAFVSHTANIKTIFCDTKPGSKPAGLGGILKQLKMQFEGRPHSGIDDSRNIARIVLWLLNNNGNFKALPAN